MKTPITVGEWPGKAPQTPADQVSYWNDFIKTNDAKITALDELIANAEVRKVPLALPAAMGDQKATDNMRAIDGEISVALNDRKNKLLARDQAGEELKQAALALKLEEQAAVNAKVGQSIARILGWAADHDEAVATSKAKMTLALQETIEIQKLSGRDVNRPFFVIQHASDYPNLRTALTDALARIQ